MDAGKAMIIATIGAAGVAGVFGLATAIIGATSNESAATHITLDKTEPRSGHDGVSVRDGYVATGEVTGLPVGDTLWLTDKEDAGYTIAEQARVSDGLWEAESYPVGDAATTVPFTMTAALVWADTECANSLRESLNKEEYFLATLPEGCREAATLDLDVTEP